jgi:hypothetical protein
VFDRSTQGWWSVTSTELFERRAERGRHRGAAAVWAQAARGIDADHGSAPTRSTGAWGLRGAVLGLAAVMTAVMAVAVVGLVGTSSPWSTEPDQIPGNPDRDEPFDNNSGEDSDELATLPLPPSPAPIVVSGMELEWALGPRDDPASPGRIPAVNVINAIVHARESEPFAGPIIGVNQLDGSGFQAWGANLSEPLSIWSDQVGRTEAGWTLDQTTGLEQVAEVTVDETHGLYPWHLVFRDVDQTATLQAWTINRDTPVDWLWTWVAEAASQSDEPIEVAPVVVLGNPGIVVKAGSSGGEPLDTVLWYDDTHMYRLLGSVLQGDTDVPTPASPLIEQLDLIGRVEWDSMVEAAGDGSGRGSILFEAVIGTVVLAVVGAMVVLVRRRSRSENSSQRLDGPVDLVD